jgi:hypothetical protein
MCSRLPVVVAGRAAERAKKKNKQTNKYYAVSPRGAAPRPPPPTGGLPAHHQLHVHVHVRPPTGARRTREKEPQAYTRAYACMMHEPLNANTHRAQLAFSL